MPTRFWKSAIRWLAAGRIRSNHGKARLDLDRSRLEVGQALSVEARLGDPEILAEGGDLPPLLGPSQLHREGRRESLGLAIAGQPECL